MGCVRAHTRVVSVGGGRALSPFFSARRRKEYILARRSFIISAGRSFSTLRQSFFCLVSPSFFFFFFQTDHPLFWTAPPHRKGVETTGERNRSSFAEILSQTRYYFSLLSCVQFCSVLLRLRSLRGRLTGIYLRFVCIHAIWIFHSEIFGQSN